MKNKKTKWIKLLSIGGAVMAIGAVPVAMTACAKKSTSQTVTKVTPKIKSDITIVGKFSDLVSTTDGTTTDQLISQDLQKDLSKVLENSNEIKETKVTFNSNLTDEDKKFNDGTKDYSEWKTNASQNVVYYSSTSPQLTVKSTKDLNTQLTPTALSDIMKKAGFTSSENKDFKLNNENKIGVDKDMLHVSVTATDKGGKKASPTNVDLVIPTSDINFAPDKATVEISGANVNTKNQQVTFKYDVGIDSTVNFTKTTIDLDAGKNITNGTDVLEALGWKQASVASKQLSRNALMSTFVEKEGTGTNEINSEKMGNDIGVFNSKFTNFKVTETQNGSGLYNLTVSAIPNDGYQWDDGTKDQKELTIATNVDINVKDAEVKDLVLNDTESEAWGLDAYDKGPNKTSDISELKNFFKEMNNSNNLLDYVNNGSEDKGIINSSFGKTNLKNVSFKSINTDGIKLTNKKQKDTEQVILIPLVLSPNNSHTWKNSKNKWAKPNIYFYITIPFKTVQ
ncbi:P35 family lipoprotein [Malacoplasma iowae]|uniref:p35 lipoprotein family protein n=1 Tax=Malacoplasma iowae DK-CPA TaxID=1394179 RepID=A0A084U421_MALIO|nr:P35 family lipoprotein [Malacoplasma iowae]KFB07707.1 P35 lipoprotein family protein [Malacoplasma iowae DK-CPA]WPL40959.1 P35 family lipoprotein [Malacoplasma iowae]